MIIGCTKKLQDEIEPITQKRGIEEKELFSWSANLIKIKRRKAVIVVNDKNRFGFVLFGLKSKDFLKIDELILQGIKRSLKQLKIREEIIEQYLSDAGETVYTKTNGHKYVARLNKACELVGLFEDILDLDNVYQEEISIKLNYDLIKTDKSNYEHPCELILEDLKEVYGESVIKCEANSLLVKLDLGGYTAERRIVTPVDINFKKLHKILQIAFDWKDCHLHDFDIINEKGERELKIISEYEDEIDLYNPGCKVVLESEAYIRDYIKDEKIIKYSYDFGDGWEHEIIFEGEIVDYNRNHPFCVDGFGDGAPEDVGGIPGYEEFLEIMGNASHPEYKSMKIWAASQMYRKFDIDFVNRRLKYLELEL
ncbi:hypothetical protein B0P06_003856 [Clostridium saccharoperbutylacetonicum]|uniref:Plasmid pRiA4b ORF-3-like protein n=2 Tax=Clostridium saccharoperbutylacetonicum TaxID=36745 RepID=M1LX69_9CLOT|nr:plasmid pRiA4b ORF-3 family protein [Clostridium saccharoperbutylacetonicum]AGF57835.1 plasmid pRiA4b ORF-3-like protein [Clostridium saccharoperbutylacetonicum N1-4(HMT)]NSB24711.1 hypothetical protein [Clostridium saccharoperbutylacetonicum]NSB44085.1 hypothetical protein [Clostridium saccharoperbutylacetonicum]